MAVKRKAARRRKSTPRSPAANSSAGGIEMIIGEIRGTLTSLRDTVESERDEREADRDTAAQYRQDIRDTLDVIKGKVAEIAGPDGRRIDNLEKVALDFRTFRNRIIGAMFAFTVFWTLAGSMITDKIKKVFA